MGRKKTKKLMVVVFAALLVMLVSAGTVSATDSGDMDIQAEIRNIWTYDAMSPIVLFGQNANLGQVVQADLSADSFSDPLPTYDSRCLGPKNYDKSIVSRFREGDNKVRIVVDITGGTGFNPGSEGYIRIINPDYKITKIFYSQPYDSDYMGVYPPSHFPDIHTEWYGFGVIVDTEEGSISWQGRGGCPACACRENYVRMEFSVEKVGSNEPPIANAGGPYEGGEGSPIIFDASGSSDSDGDPLTYRWDFDNDGNWDTGWSSSPTASYTWDDDWSGEAKVEVSDGELSDTDTASVTVNNVAPTITSLTGPVDPVEDNNAVSLIGDFTDQGLDDTHTATFDWGDTTSTDYELINGEREVTGTHTYTEAGVYTVTLTVTDDDGGSDSEIFQYVVVYDPDGGFVTGGGWINSPAGASAQYPDAEGKATFGFVSKYVKGQTTPTGNTQFNFNAGNINFHSNNYDWLVIAGHKAMYKGTGTINDDGNYGFMLSAIDEKLTPSTDVDMFRIRIWDKDNGDAVVYDNNIGNDDDADPTTALGSGTIIIHKVK